MLNKTKACILKIAYKYYQMKADYCYRKAGNDKSKSDNYWCMRTAMYTDKELNVATKLIQMGEI